MKSGFHADKIRAFEKTFARLTKEERDKAMKRVIGFFRSWTRSNSHPTWTKGQAK